MSLFDRVIASSVRLLPKPVVRRVADRYVAGEDLSDAVRVVHALNQAGCRATIDLLGENVKDEAAAAANAAGYVGILDAISREKLDSNVSIKLTAFGLDLSTDLAFRNVRAVVDHAKKLGNFVRIDMENSPYTDRTIDVYKALRRDFDNVGIVLQACLRRTPEDVESILPFGGHFRLCKGIYVESRAIAWRQPDVVNRNYVHCLRKMLSGGAFVGIATHDERLVFEALRILDELRVRPDRFEFQMLLGVDEGLRGIILKLGHPVRVYVPYGRDWHGYSLRRLKENPKIAGYVFRAMLPGGSRGPK
jgi:proline dehydrogenase